MSHLGDYDVATILYGKFTTFRPSTGAAYTLAVYRDNSTTESTSFMVNRDADGLIHSIEARR